MRLFVATGVLVLFGCAPADSAAPDPVVLPDTSARALNEPLRRELLRMGMLDRTVRAGFTPDIQGDTVFLRASLAMDSALTRRLRSIVLEHGWPARTVVGDDAADAAALILMNSPSATFQREMLPLLDSMAALGEAGRNHAATLTDRLRIFEGKPQRFGTQFHIADDALVPYPIESPAQLEQRRSAAGLSTMAEYVGILRQTYGGPVLWPLRSVADPRTSDTVSPPPDTTAVQPAA